MAIVVFAGDEAGDASFKFDYGSTRYFVVAFISTGQPDELRQAVAQFRRKQGLSAHHEFSFHEVTARGIRERFFAMLAKQFFRAWILGVDKPSLPEKLRVMHGNSFYQFFMSELIRVIPDDAKRNAVLLLDEYGAPGKTVIGLRQMMKRRGVSKGFKKIIARRSQSEDLIQVADMVAGAALRQFAKGDGSYLQIITGRIALLMRYG